MSSKYRMKQKKKAKMRDLGAHPKRVFKDEWDAMYALLEYNVEAEYDSEIYIPHDHLPQGALDAIDYLVSRGYTPVDVKYTPKGVLTTHYLREGTQT